jgi:multidrug efflux pump subunit AcrA (membrane-fusion protein)
MRVGMVRMDMARRLNAHRVLSLVLCSLALVGWGAFADLCAELAQLKVSQDQLLAERKQQQEAVGDLTQLQAQIASARDELQAFDHKREQAKVQAAAVQQDRTELTKWLDGKRTKGSEKDSVRATKPSSKPARIAARTQPET